MFFWTTTRRDGGNKGAQKPTRKAFRPEGDRLETREVLSTVFGPVSSTSHFISGIASGLANNLASRGLSTGLASSIGSTGLSSSVGSTVASQFANLGANSGASRVMAGMNFGTPANGFTGLTINLVRSPIFGSTNSSLVATNNNTPSSAFSNSAATGAIFANTGITNHFSQRSIPTEAGLQNNVNTNLRNTIGQFFPPSSFPQSTLNSVTNGLAFTGGLGFSSPSAGNSVQNGLAFTNGSGFSTPARVSNSASNGLAFTNGSGFSTPSRGFNSASNGLAFTNGSGFSTPASIFNAATNGLSFTGGLGFTNPNTNPFFSF